MRNLNRTLVWGRRPDDDIVSAVCVNHRRRRLRAVASIELNYPAGPGHCRRRRRWGGLWGRVDRRHSPLAHLQDDTTTTSNGVWHATADRSIAAVVNRAATGCRQPPRMREIYAGNCADSAEPQTGIHRPRQVDWWWWVSEQKLSRQIPPSEMT